jgi:hypothetical protein
LAVASIQTVHSAAHLLRIPRTRSYYVNNTIDLATFNWVWPKTAAAATADCEGNEAEDQDSDEAMLDMKDGSRASSITSSDTEDEGDDDDDYD